MYAGLRIGGTHCVATRIAGVLRRRLELATLMACAALRLGSLSSGALAASLAAYTSR
jgi:hypothetical protein